MTALPLLALLLLGPTPPTRGVVGTGAVYVTPPTISRDTGASFPILASDVTGPMTTVTTAAFDTTASATLVVVRVALGNFSGDDWGAPTCVWSGGTPGNATAFTQRIASSFGTAGSYRVAIFTSTITGALSGVAVVAGGTNSIADASTPIISVAVDALVNASSTMGTTAAEPHDGVSGDHAVALSGVVAGSWVFAVASAEIGAFAPVGGTTEESDINRDASVAVALGVNTVGDSPTSVGWSTASTWGTTAALEIKKQ